MKYSFIIPLYNRPDEIDELLASLTRQEIKDFEVIIVEDGSQITSQHICQKYQNTLDIHYLSKANSGPGPTRNYGAQHAKGQYIIILDSDVVLPERYLCTIDIELEQQPVDAFGGPDRAQDTFTPVQKAITYSMTSFFTTGGIRGGQKQLDKFYPRSFNMGVRKEVFDALGGFAPMRFGEDIDFSTRLFKAGYKVMLYPEAWVWHKRRTDFTKFFRQVNNSGIARIHLYKKYPDTLKIVHLLPSLFTIGSSIATIILITGILLPFFNTGPYVHHLAATALLFSLLPLAIYCTAIFTDASLRFRSMHVGILAIIASFTQLFGYGLGFIQAWWKRCILKQGEYSTFKNNFYK